MSTECGWECVGVAVFFKLLDLRADLRMLPWFRAVCFVRVVFLKEGRKGQYTTDGKYHTRAPSQRTDRTSCHTPR